MKKKINVYKMIQKIENKEIREDAEKMLFSAITNKNFTNIITDIIETDLPPISKLIDDGIIINDELLDKMISIIRMSLNDNIESLDSIDKLQEAKIIINFIISSLDKLCPLKDSIIKEHLLLTQTDIQISCNKLQSAWL